MRVVAYVFPWLLVGCSGVSPEPIADVSPATPATPQAPTTSAAPVAPPPATVAPPPPPPAKDTRFFPGETGREWDYAGDESAMFGSTQSFTFKTTVTGTATIGGKSAWIVTSDTNGQTGDSYVALEGDDEYTRSAGDTVWKPALRSPAKDGASWTYTVSDKPITSTWHSIGSATVKAGTFDECWRIDSTFATTKPGDVYYSVVCRGVGTVKTDIEQTDGYIYRFELTKKSF
jgi:hypothetical protein